MKLLYDPAVPLLALYLKQKWNPYARHMFALPCHCNCIYNSQDRKSTEESISGQMDKENVMHTHSGILLSLEGRSEPFQLGQHGWTWRTLYCVTWTRPRKIVLHVTSLTCEIVESPAQKRVLLGLAREARGCWRDEGLGRRWSNKVKFHLKR